MLMGGGGMTPSPPIVLFDLSLIIKSEISFWSICLITFQVKMNFNKTNYKRKKNNWIIKKQEHWYSENYPHPLYTYTALH